ncbi:MAG: LamG domain-containing protein [Acidobacteria bacterium]|nr:LamG domain-containing protein [Acidobacteriota bacterium]
MVAHWNLDGDFRDSVGAHHGEGRGVKFVEGRDGRSGGAALFDGVENLIEVPHDIRLFHGSDEFSISAWVNLGENLVSVHGGILTKYDPAARRGVNLTVMGSSPGYSSMGDAKYLHFGIDNAINGSWMDCGKPWKSNPLIGTLVVYKGRLYAGLGDASRPEDACHVFRYEGGTDWVDCGRLGSHPLTASVFSVVVHKGHLYGGTGVWDWLKAHAGMGGPNHVYRYEGGTEWRDCGQVGNGYRTMSLASFNGELYAADDTLPGKVYKYEGGTSWSFCGRLGAKRERLVNCMTVYRGHLYGSTHPGIYRYEGGAKWESIGHGPFESTQIHKLQVYDGHLYAGTWPHGKVLRYEGEGQWTDCGQLGISTERHQINEVNDLAVYNGKLYAGVIPKAEVYRYEWGQEWTLLRRLVANQGWSPNDVASWCRVPSLTVFQGKLFQGTSTCFGRFDPTGPPEAGRVYAMEAGKNVSYDDDLGAGWKHVVAVRERGLMKLYVDGQLRAASAPFDNADYETSNIEPLLIGFGAQNYFSGVLDDIRIYGGPLTAAQVSTLYQS